MGYTEYPLNGKKVAGWNRTGYTQELRRVLTRKDPGYLRHVYDADRTGIYLRLCDGDDGRGVGFGVHRSHGGHVVYGTQLREDGGSISVAARRIRTRNGINCTRFFAGWAMFLDYVLVPLIVFMVGAACTLYVSGRAV